MTKNENKMAGRCAAGNSVNFSGCSGLRGVNIEVAQKITQSCLTEAITVIKNNASDAKEFSTSMQENFANKVATDAALQNDLLVKNLLEKVKTNDGLGGMVNSVCSELGETARSAFNSLTGGKTDKKSIQETKTKIRNIITTNTRNENDIKNIVNNIKESKVQTDNITGCDLKTDTNNKVDFSNCNDFQDVNIKIGQIAEVKSFQKCANYFANTSILQDKSVTDALTIASTDTATKAEVKSKLDADNAIRDEEANTGGLDLFGLGGIIGIIVVIVVLVIVYKLISGSSKGSSSADAGSTDTGLPDVE